MTAKAPRTQPFFSRTFEFAHFVMFGAILVWHKVKNFQNPWETLVIWRISSGHPSTYALCTNGSKHFAGTLQKEDQRGWLSWIILGPGSSDIRAELTWPASLQLSQNQVSKSQSISTQSALFATVAYCQRQRSSSVLSSASWSSGCAKVWRDVYL